MSRSVAFIIFRKFVNHKFPWKISEIYRKLIGNFSERQKNLAKWTLKPLKAIGQAPFLLQMLLPELATSWMQCSPNEGWTTCPIQPPQDHHSTCQHIGIAANGAGIGALFGLTHGATHGG